MNSGIRDTASLLALLVVSVRVAAAQVPRQVNWSDLRIAGIAPGQDSSRVLGVLGAPIERSGSKWRYSHLELTLTARGLVNKIAVLDSVPVTTRGLHYGDPATLLDRLYGQDAGQIRLFLIGLNGEWGMLTEVRGGLVVRLELGHIVDPD
jgi:hypothetical protein